MSYQLYYAKGSAAMGVRVLLEELDQPYQIIESTIDRSKPRPAQQMKANPNGWLPVLIYGDKSMYEAAAITIYLCDKHFAPKLAPGLDDPQRGLYLQTLVYFTSSLQNAFQMNYYPDRFADTSEAEASAMARGCRRLTETWTVIDEQIGEKDFVLGDKFSAVDVYLFMLTTWLKPERGHPPLGSFPNVERIARKVATRSAVQKVYGTDVTPYVT